MSIVIGFCVILGFLALGECVSYMIGHFVPGSVLGMLFLFFALVLKWVKPDTVRPVATFLTKNMSIFFIPAFMGIMDQWGMISLNLWEWLIVVFFSTVFVFFTSGYTAKKIMDKLSSKKGGQEQC